MRAHLTALLLAACAAACSSNEYRYAFEPSPHEVWVQPDGQGPVIARALIAVLGGERLKGEKRPVMLLRVLLENKTDSELAFDPDLFLLVGSDLVPFGTPRFADDVRMISIPPGEASTIDVAFPFPGDLELGGNELQGLNLRWGLRHANESIEVSAAWDRKRRNQTIIHRRGIEASLGYRRHRRF